MMYTQLAFTVKETREKKNPAIQEFVDQVGVAKLPIHKFESSIVTHWHGKTYNKTINDPEILCYAQHLDFG